MERVVGDAPPGQLDILERHAITHMVVEIEHIAKQHQRNDPNRQDHAQRAIAKTQQLAPAVGLQRQNGHREDHQHTLITNRRHQHAGYGHPEPAMAIGKQEQHQRECHKQRLGIGRNKVDGKGRKRHQPDPVARRIQILPQLPQAEEEERQHG